MPKLLLVLALLLLSSAPTWADSETKLDLNAGERWKVEPKMMVYLRAMEKDLREYPSASNSQKQLLHRELQSNLQKLVSNCTMTGPAHDQLHNWLVPYMEMVNTMASEKDATRRNAMAEKLLKSYTVFNTYFE